MNKHNLYECNHLAAAGELIESGDGNKAYMTEWIKLDTLQDAH